MAALVASNFYLRTKLMLKCALFVVALISALLPRSVKAAENDLELEQVFNEISNEFDTLLREKKNNNSHLLIDAELPLVFLENPLWPNVKSNTKHLKKRKISYPKRTINEQKIKGQRSQDDTFSRAWTEGNVELENFIETYDSLDGDLTYEGSDFVR